MGKLGSSLMSLLLFGAVLLVAPPAAAANDADLGEDAPDSWKSAADVPVGRLTGAIGFTDDDWYRVAVPPGKAVRVTVVSGPWDYFLEARSDGGTILASEHKPHSFTPDVAIQTGTPSEGLRFGILEDFFSGDYTLQIDLIDAPDLDIESVVVQDGSISTVGSEAPNPINKVIEVTVKNSGLVDALEAQLTTHVVPATQPTAQERKLPIQAFELAVGESKTLSVPWDTRGQLGDVEIVATANVAIDANPLDNTATEQAKVLVGGLQTGLDLVNHKAERDLLPAGVEAGAVFLDHDSGWTGLTITFRTTVGERTVQEGFGSNPR